MSEILTRWQDPTIKELKKQLQQKENIIKEVREYAQEKANEFDLDLKDEELTYVERHNFENEKSKYIHILEILDKGE